MRGIADDAALAGDEVAKRQRRDLGGAELRQVAHAAPREFAGRRAALADRAKRDEGSTERPLGIGHRSLVSTPERVFSAARHRRTMPAMDTTPPLASAPLTTILPVRDLDRARRFYVDAWD
jgi:hypothetical protein